MCAACLPNSRTCECMSLRCRRLTSFARRTVGWLKDNIIVYSAFGSRFGAGVSLLVGRSLVAIVNVVFSGDGGRLLVADVAVKTFKFRIVAVHAAVHAAETRSFLRKLGSSLDS